MTLTALHPCEVEIGDSLASLVRCGNPARRRGDVHRRRWWVCDECASVLHVEWERESRRRAGAEFMGAAVGLCVGAVLAAVYERWLLFLAFAIADVICLLTGFAARDMTIQSRPIEPLPRRR